MPLVLVIEDDIEIRATLRLALEDEGYTVLEAQSGEEALALLRANTTPIVALVDLLLPVLSGEDILKAVAADSDLARRHAYILMTANQLSLDADFAAILEQLQTPVIHKPFDLDVLLNTISHAAERIGA